MQVAGFKKVSTQCDGCVVGVGQSGVFDHHATSTRCFENLDEMLQKQVRGFTCFDGKVLLYF